MLYPRWYHFLLDVKVWHRYALLTLGLIVLFLSWIFLGYLPLYRYVDELRMKLKQQDSQMSTSVQERKNCQRLADELSQVRSDLVVYANNNDSLLSTSIAHIMAELDAAKLTLQSVTKESLRDKGWYQTVPVALHASGALKDIIQWLQMMAANSLLLQCEDIEIMSLSADEYTLRCRIKFFVTKKDVEKLSPSTLEKAEGLGG